MAAKAEAANQTRPRRFVTSLALPRKRSEPSLRKANRAPSAASWIGFRIDQEQVLKLDWATLPPDAEFEGYEEVVVQEFSSNSCSEPEEVAGGCAPTG